MRTEVATVFGGTGFLGQRICQVLADNGWTVRVASRHPDKQAPGLTGACERVTADIRNPSTVHTALEGAAAVINAVSLYTESRHLRFEDIHVDGARELAAQAARQQIDRFVHISGVGVDTSSPSAYVRARARGEDVVRQAYPRATIIRPAVLFGSRDALLSNLKRLSRLPVAPLFGRGDTRLQPVHVDDIARGVAAALHQPASAGETFELGGAQTLNYRELLLAVATTMKRHPRLVPVPFPLWHLLAAVMGIFPHPPLTRDQLYLLQKDNVTSDSMPGFEALGEKPQGVKDLLEQCL